MEVSVSFYEMQGIRNAYRDACAKMGVAMEKPLLLRFTELEVVMLAPIVPHFADNVWRTLLHKTESIWKGTWPVVKPVALVRLLQQERAKPARHGEQEAEEAARQLAPSEQGVRVGSESGV